MQVRLIPGLGVPADKTISVGVMNDTGSDSLGLWVTDFAELGLTNLNSGEYKGFGPPIEFHTAMAAQTKHVIRVQVQLMDDIDPQLPISDWFEEEAVCNHKYAPSQARLSGRYMRQHMYFLTAPGNSVLFVANRKDELIRLMPETTATDVRNTTPPATRFARMLGEM